MITRDLAKIDDVYYERTDNGCPFHTLHCNLSKMEVKFLITQLECLRRTRG